MTVIPAVIGYLIGTLARKSIMRAQAAAHRESDAEMRAKYYENRVAQLEARLHPNDRALPVETEPDVPKCQHRAAVAVESGLPAAGVPMAVVAWWCPTCAEQLSEEPKALVDRRKRQRQNEEREQRYIERMERDKAFHEFMNDKFEAEHGYSPGGLTK